MTNKVIGDYDATATPVRTDLLLAQPAAGGLYKTYTPADVLGLLEASDVPDLSATRITSDELDTARLPDGVLTLDDVALDGTLRSVKDKDGNESVLKLSTSEVTIQGMTIGFGSGAISTNVAIGTDALLSNTSGERNVAIGTDALLSNTSGARNLAIGAYALEQNLGGDGVLDGDDNVAIGERALRYNTSGFHCTGVGVSTLCANTTGIYNTAIGASALGQNTTGDLNVAIGRRAGKSTSASAYNVTSTKCICLGADTKVSADGVTNETVIGVNTSGNGSNTVTIAEKPVFPDMPTSSSGLPSGSLYSDGGTIKIV